MIREDLGAFVISYNRPSCVKVALEKILNQTMSPGLLIVVDNSDHKEKQLEIEEICKGKAEYHPMDRNLGPAYAAFYGLKYLAAKGFDWIYWGDDDNPPRFEDNFQRILNIMDSSGIPEKIGALGAVGHKFCWSNGRVDRIDNELLKENVEVDVIAGGMNLIVSSLPVKEALLPNPELFFGFEEYDYCLRLKKAGYHLYVNGGLMLEYRKSTGRLDYKANRNIIPQPDFFPWRRYYVNRNMIYLMLYEYKKIKIAFKLIVIAILKGFTGLFNGPKSGLANLALMLRAVRDGITKRMGRTVNPR